MSGTRHEAAIAADEQAVVEAAWKEGRALREQEHQDDLLMELGSEHGDTILGLRFVSPPESGPRGDASKLPGIYLRPMHPNKSPTRRIRHEERLLTKAEAVEWAAMVDRLARVEDAFAEDGRPRNNEELVHAWYAALARRLGRAIDATTSRTAELRELHAALTGSPYVAGGQP